MKAAPEPMAATQGTQPSNAGMVPSSDSDGSSPADTPLLGMLGTPVSLRPESEREAGAPAQGADNRRHNPANPAHRPIARFILRDRCWEPPANLPAYIPAHVPPELVIPARRVLAFLHRAVAPTHGAIVCGFELHRLYCRRSPAPRAVFDRCMDLLGFDSVIPPWGALVSDRAPESRAWVGLRVRVPLAWP